MRTERKLRILLAAGARPNFVKIAPLAAALARPENAARADAHLVHTGQHYDAALSHLFFEQLGIPRPDVNLEVGSGSHARQTAEVMARFEPVARDWKPDVVVVVGDVNSTLACALVAAKLGIRVAHVEAGLRSFDRSMPEEINRKLTDAVSDFLFVTEPAGVENLRREGIPPEKIFLTGNVMIDSLRRFLPLAKQSSALRDLSLLAEDGNSAAPFALLTLHRPSNVDDAERLRALLGVLEEIGRRLPLIFPAHPRTQERMREFGVLAKSTSVLHLRQTDLRVTDPMGYLEFLHLMSEAKFVLTDSGGIQEETTALGIPCLTLRENTERPVTVEQGTNEIVGRDPQKILAAVDAILAGRGKRGRAPDLWDGHAAERIVEILLKKAKSD
jgi:UDP-N-acetylglucosamine 2-epimerase (non-hydrolysing)